MTEIEEAKARLRVARWVDGSAVYVEADKDDLKALLAHVDRLEHRLDDLALLGLSTPAPDDPVERLRAGLLYLVGTSLNELTVRGLPFEWSAGSGLGEAASALGLAPTDFAGLVALVRESNDGFDHLPRASSASQGER
jgi:hypothetical protein